MKTAKKSGRSLSGAGGIAGSPTGASKFSDKIGSHHKATDSPSFAPMPKGEYQSAGGSGSMRTARPIGRRDK